MLNKKQTEQLVEEALTEEFILISERPLTIAEARELSSEVMARVDIHNRAVAHKSVGWLARWFLETKGINKKRY